MQRVEIFDGLYLEKSINNWLEKQEEKPGFEVLNIKYAAASDGSEDGFTAEYSVLIHYRIDNDDN